MFAQTPASAENIVKSPPAAESTRLENSDVVESVSPLSFMSPERFHELVETSGLRNQAVDPLVLSQRLNDVLTARS